MLIFSTKRNESKSSKFRSPTRAKAKISKRYFQFCIKKYFGLDQSNMYADRSLKVCLSKFFRFCFLNIFARIEFKFALIILNQHLDQNS